MCHGDSIVGSSALTGCAFSTSSRCSFTPCYGPAHPPSHKSIRGAVPAAIRMSTNGLRHLGRVKKPDFRRSVTAPTPANMTHRFQTGTILPGKAILRRDTTTARLRMETVIQPIRRPATARAVTRHMATQATTTRGTTPTARGLSDGRCRRPGLSGSRDAPVSQQLSVISR